MKNTDPVPMNMRGWRIIQNIVRYSGLLTGCVAGFSLSRGSLVLGTVALLICISGILFIFLAPRRMRGQEWILQGIGKVVVHDVVSRVGVTFWPTNKVREGEWMVISEDEWEKHARRVK